MKTLKFITALAVILALTAFAANVEIFEGAGTETAYNQDQELQKLFLQNENGDVVSLSDYTKSEGLILIFATQEALVSKSNEHKMLNLNTKYKKMGYPVILVNPVKSEANIESANNSGVEKMKKLYLLDESQQLYSNPIAVETPLIYALQKKPEGFNIKFIGSLGGKKNNNHNADVAYMKKAVSSLVEDEE